MRSPKATLKVAPLKLAPNCVWRSYLGGSTLRRFRRLPEGGDDHFPEDWLASTVRARNGENQQGPDEGLSSVMVDGEEITFSSLIAQHPEWFWGTQKPPVNANDQTGVLIKLLDSSVRLHLQAHPDRRFVEQRFGGTAGKTECWYILATRHDDAYVYLGFQTPPRQDDWARMIREQDLDAMRSCFEKIPVKAGDCLVVPATVPHAIGDGVFMMELQEPTDWVVRCEFSAGGHVLPHADRFMGLELQDVLSMLDYTEYSLTAVAQQFRQTPEVLRETPAFREERVIGAVHQSYFRLRRLSGSGEVSWLGGEPAILLALQGAGTLEGESVQAGDTWVLPGAVQEWCWQTTSNDWCFLLAQPPIR